MNDAVAFLPNFILVKTRVTHSAASFAVTRKLTQKNYDVDLNWGNSSLDKFGLPSPHLPPFTSSSLGKNKVSQVLPREK